MIKELHERGMVGPIREMVLGGSSYLGSCRRERSLSYYDDDK